jgi:hypothetical protein
MPNQRSPSQRLLNLAVSREFLSELDDCLADLGYGNRSDFIRQAIMEKLAGLGVILPRRLAGAPARAGRTGRRPYPRLASGRPGYPQTAPTSLILNEMPPANAPLGKVGGKLESKLK